jgi:23S rRNA pseudouridine1911/1915/1917 synthase
MLSIVHEDDDLLVVDKPADLVCHPSKDGPESSLIGRVRLHLGHADGRLVNRLDRETSGLVLLAKGRQPAAELGRLFAGSGVSKRYLAIVHGDPGPHRRIDAPIGKDASSPVAIKGWVHAAGSPAVTDVTRIRTVADGSRPLVLVEARPATGRKHQIRIHLASIGHPIVGDKIYGGDEGRYLRFVARELTREDLAALILPSHALHAFELAFTWRGRTRSWRAEPPPLFRSLARRAALPAILSTEASEDRPAQALGSRGGRS